MAIEIDLGKVVGDSAYEIAKKNGYSGSETEWLASLHGSDGNSGVASADGVEVVKNLDNPSSIPEDTPEKVQVPGAKITAQKLSELSLNIGDLSKLETDNKTDLVSAINEAATKGGGGGGDSKVTINVSTTVGGAQTSGLVLRVIIDDNLDTKQELTTDAEGKASFVASAGSKFEIYFPHQAGCEDIKPISRYAVKNQININAIYAPEATHYELLSVHVYKWVGNSHSNFANCPIHITIDGVTEDFETATDGRFEHEIPFGTEYTLSVDEIEDMYVYGHTNEWKYTAGAAHREKVINYHDVEVGLFMCCSDGAEYTKDEFIASGRPGSDVVMFKIANAQLALKTTAAPNGNIFGIDLDDVVRATYNSNKIQWSTTNVQFTSCPNSQSSDGFDRTYKIVNEGIEKSVPTPAATFCFGKQFNLGGTELNGFLGAVVQHLAVVSNEQELNAMLKIARPDATNTFTTMIGATKWTIDQNNATNAFYCARTLSVTNKNYINAVLPFYAF